MEKLEYATIEAFCDKGLRVNGNVSQDLLSTFSQGVTTKQKKADERGWSVKRHHLSILTLLHIVHNFTTNELAWLRVTVCGVHLAQPHSCTP